MCSGTSRNHRQDVQYIQIGVFFKVTYFGVGQIPFSCDVGYYAAVKMTDIVAPQHSKQSVLSAGEIV